MANVVRIRPVEAGTVRVELDITLQELMTAEAFDPRSLQALSKEKELLFEIQIKDQAAFGKKAMFIPKTLRSSDRVEFLVHNVEDNVMTNSALANFIKYGKVIVTQVNKALKEYNTAVESITVEGGTK